MRACCFLPHIHSCKVNGIILMSLKATPARKSLSHEHFAYINDTFLSLSLCISLETEEKLLFGDEIRFSIFFPEDSFYDHMTQIKSGLTISPGHFCYNSVPFYRSKCYNTLPCNHFSLCDLKYLSCDLIFYHHACSLGL